MSDIQPSVVYRTGRPTVADYDEAIEALQEARTQLEPDARGCIVCSDCDHQAWECRHNPLVMARRAATMEGEWRCFHCGAVFTDSNLAKQHFGSDADVTSACKRDDLCLYCLGSGFKRTEPGCVSAGDWDRLQADLKVSAGQLAVANDAAQFYNRKAADAVILREAAEIKLEQAEKDRAEEEHVRKNFESTVDVLRAEVESLCGDRERLIKMNSAALHCIGLLHPTERTPACWCERYWGGEGHSPSCVEITAILTTNSAARSASVPSDRDWTEGHENGRYQNRCINCGQNFFGHKRRVTCKVCASAVWWSAPEKEK